MEARDELSNMELVTLAIYRLGGALTPVDIEDAAIEVFRLAPRKFSWLKHEDQIDLRTVQYAAKNACNPDIGLLRGSIRHGYMLSQAGLEWAEKLGEVRPDVSSQARKMSSADLVEREKLRLSTTQAFKKFIAGQGKSITIMEFREFARVNDYFPTYLRQQRYEKIENAVRDDAELKASWDYLKERFAGE